MQISPITAGAAVLLAFAPSVLATGMAIIKNECDFPVFYQSVDQLGAPAMAQLPTDGITDPFRVGVAMKLAKTLTEKPTQFEYSTDSGKIAYDISNIDGNPFVDFGMQVSPSILTPTGFPTCLNVTCAPGISPCAQAYNAPNDRRTMVCDDSTNLTMTLCPKLTPEEIAAALLPNHMFVKRHQHRAHARQVKF